ncbi:MAG: histidine--tRNA ligase [Candidatus Omnitrophota bacterium]
MYKLVRGTYDLLPAEAERLQGFLGRAIAILERAGFREIATPILEEAVLFNRSVGEESEIVSKEMYLFSDRKGRMLALRPEGTVPVVRAYLEHNFPYANPSVRFYYFGPMFRYCRPQSGRYRQFLQLGVESFGSAEPYIDAEIISTLTGILTSAGIGSFVVEINSLGCQDCQKSFGKIMAEFLKEREGGLCPDCQQRLRKNPLRTFDCKVPSCREVLKEAPAIDASLCSGCRRHFEEVLNYSRILGVSYRVNPRLVRGLDYYTRTVWEVLSAKDSQAIAAGGRYDNLVADLGGPPTPALGFAIGIERLLSLTPAVESGKLMVRLVYLDNDSLEKSLSLLASLRKECPFSITISSEGKSLKAQLRSADRDGCQYALIIGPEEIEKKKVILRDLTSGTQETIEEEKLIERVRILVPTH